LTITNGQKTINYALVYGLGLLFVDDSILGVSEEPSLG